MKEITRTIQEIFSPSGGLSRFPWYEDRPQQREMAVAVADALADSAHLIVEAPTGVGKTLSYLIPAILHASDTGKKAIISTYTKNLQEQILQNDIPITKTLLAAKPDVAALKGRSNYLCTTRLAHALGATASLFDKDGTSQLKAIAGWAKATTDGDLEHLPFSPRADIWALVRSEKEVCTSRACSKDCFFQKARERARQANVVIMNHALFFTLLTLQDSPDHFIFDDDFVVFDEAHTLESVASATIGKSLSRSQVLSILHRLYNPRTRKGLVAHEKGGLRSLCKGAETETISFFERIRAALLSTTNETRFGRGRQYLRREVRVRHRDLVTNSLDSHLTALRRGLHALAEACDNDARRHELVLLEHSLSEAQMLVSEFLEQPHEAFAYWVESSGPQGENITLAASPVEVADVLRRRLFDSGAPVVMTSATLAVDGALRYFQDRIGGHDARTLILDSPFDHMRQMKVRLVQELPEPESTLFAADLPAWVMRSIKESGGRALVLFTNTQLMQSVASQLAAELDNHGLRLLVQGEELQRSELVQEFRRDIRSVLFGLESFWMGIDVPGEALEHVVITRLPFAVPSHPLIEARIERIEQLGGNAFTDYALPEAVLKFRQGVGRLIRTRTDRGLITILDSRILTRHYGRVFLSSLPRCPIEILTKSGEILELPSGSFE